jgi:hypothetical protein
MSQYVLTPEFVKEWNRIRKKVDSMRGAGVSNTPFAITIAASGGGDSIMSSGLRLVLVRVSSAATGGGYYNGKLLRPPHSLPDGTANLLLTHIATVPANDDALIANLAEENQADHQLTDSFSNVTTFLGLLLPGVNSNGKHVVVTNGYDWGFDCQTNLLGGE